MRSESVSKIFQAHLFTLLPVPSAMADPSRPVTGYPAPAQGYPQPNPNGYPYPPQQHPNYAYPYPHPHNAAAASRATLIRRLITAMIFFFVISALIVFVIWLVLRPRLPNFSVDSVSLSNFNVSSSQTVSGNWVVQFSVYNPNKKMKIVYDDIDSIISYRAAFLSETRIPPFSQGTKTQTSVNASFSATNSYVESWAVSRINGDRSRGTVSFNVKVLAYVGFRTGGWKMRRRLLRVVCEDVAVGVSANGSGSGKLVGDPKECRVGI